MSYECPNCDDLSEKVARLQSRLSKAEGYLKRVVDPASHPPEPFHDLLLEITTFLSGQETGKETQIKKGGDKENA